MKTKLLTFFWGSMWAFPTLFAANGTIGLKRDSIYMDVLRHGRVSVGYVAYFPSSSAVSQTIGSNASQIARLDAFFEVNLRDSVVYLDRVDLLGSASVEGSPMLNEQLSHRRALFLRDYLDGRYNLSARMPINVMWTGADWDGLTADVARTSLWELPDRNEILSIIRNVSVYDGREAMLRKLDGGHPYQYIKAHFFPNQRRAVITLIYNMKKSFEQRLGHPIEDYVVDSIVANALLQPYEAQRFIADRTIQSMPVNMPNPEYYYAWDNGNAVNQTRNVNGRIRSMLEQTLTNLKRPIEEMSLKSKPNATKVPEPVVVVPPAPITQDTTTAVSNASRSPYSFRPYVVVKTNLLSLAGVSAEPSFRAPMPNLEVEYLFSRRFSVGFAALYDSFSPAKDYDVWNVTAYTLEARYRPLVDRNYGGLYLGAYGRVGDYNFREVHPADVQSGPEYNRTGKYQEAGLSVGYTLPLGRHWVFEAGASGGYRFTDVKAYMHLTNANEYAYTTSGNGFHLTDLFLKVGYRFGIKKLKK
ncbi:MAG: DUF3575 domain-containing protein [Mediterranea sp.]|jgi:hypothetical protein|nr:DUF3575 domain-containing protein [Mediterranea sp.]